MRRYQLGIPIWRALGGPIEIELAAIAGIFGIDRTAVFIDARSAPLAARAQQTAMPVIGYLDPRSPEAVADRLRGFRQGLKESGYVEGENVAVVYGLAGGSEQREWRCNAIRTFRQQRTG